MAPINFSDAENIKRVVVDPVVLGVEEKLKGLLNAMEMRIRVVEERQVIETATMERLERRLSEAERFKAQALRWASYAGAVVGAIWSTILVVMKEKAMNISKKILGIH